MKKIMICLLFPAVIGGFSSCMSSKTDSKRMAMEENKNKFDKKMCADAKFAVCAYEGSLLAIKVAELAPAKATSPAVKQYANTIMMDHVKMNAALGALAVTKNISLPAKLSDRSQKAYDWLAKQEGAKFDKAFMKCMVKHHKNDVCEFEKEAKKGKDGDLQKWASGQVPLLKEHLKNAKALCKNL